MHVFCQKPSPFITQVYLAFGKKKKKEGSTVVDASVFITSVSLEAQRH